MSDPIVVVLGAGASRGASFAKDALCKPPTNRDFFTQLQHIESRKHQNAIARIIQDTTELFGYNFKLTLEDFFTQIEYFRKFIKRTGPRRNWSLERLEEIRENFLQGLAATLEESMTQTGSYRTIQCDYHAALVKQLRRTDTIISFNYDCIIDDALIGSADTKWNPRYGYRIPLREGYRLKGLGQRWTTRSSERVGRSQSITLLKLHGSLHWDVKEEQKEIIFKERPYTKQRGSIHFTIIPPEWNKDIIKEVSLFEALWDEADTRLRSAKHLIFIGYSLADTDLHALALFRIAIQEEKLKSIVIVNPDKLVRFKTRQVLLSGISDKTKVVVFDSLEEFHKANLRNLLQL